MATTVGFLGLPMSGRRATASAGNISFARSVCQPREVVLCNASDDGGSDTEAER